jgi:hypothetical protein
MTDSLGSPAIVGLPAAVDRLAALRKSGRLRVSHGRWSGELAFDEGRLVAAAFGTERGLAALNAIALALPGGRFAFTAGARVGERNLTQPPDELRAHLDALARFVPDSGAGCRRRTFGVRSSEHGAYDGSGTAIG